VPADLRASRWGRGALPEGVVAGTSSFSSASLLSMLCRRLQCAPQRPAAR